MVEGPTAKAYAVKISRGFRGEVVKSVFVRSKRIFVPVERLIGKKFLNADSFGKNIVLLFDGIAVRLHLMMYGTIHIYGKDEPLLKPEERVRLRIEGEARKLVVYNAPIVEINEKESLLKALREGLGPDPLSNEWDRSKAVKNIMGFPDDKIGVILLNQSVIAGIGNILRNEILFRAKVHPERRVKDLSYEELERIVEVSESLSKEFLKLKLEGKRIKSILFVYNRYRKPCKVCGKPIRYYMQEPIKRKTFVCDRCQK